MTAVPVPAATLLLVRDGPDGLEVLMTTRHEAAGFAAGALVFPGGKVCAEDRALCPPGAEDRAWRVAAIRETFEECGILLARPPEAALAARARRGPGAGFAALVAGAGIEPCADLLVPFAHWITPAASPRRFDTRFFVAPAPAGQEAAHDGREATDALWLTPRAALARAEAGRAKVVFATRMNLLKLGRCAGVAEALDPARHLPIVTVVPERAETAAGPVLRIPAAAGYGITEMPAADIPRA